MSPRAAEAFEQLRVLAREVRGRPRWRWSLAAAGGALVLIGAVGAVGLLRLTKHASPGTPASELRITLACAACGLREALTLRELAELEPGAGGLLRCPRCGALAADRYRRGTPPPIQIDVQAEADRPPGSP